MPPKFGTSGLRGLVVELTPELVSEHVHAFLQACPIGTGLYVGRDLRPSSPDIAGMIIAAARERGVEVTDCGDILTPGLALAAMGVGAAAVMVTGSHIPADRNGLKFYTPDGEITKDHEAAILGALGNVSAYSGEKGRLQTYSCEAAYVSRYVDAFPAKLSGMTVGVYSHSTVGRDVLSDILRGLGAEVIELGRSDTFIPVDTEAVPEDVRAQLKAWAADHPVDAIVSMDGDGDRPLLADAKGQVVVGHVLGQITAALLEAETVVTPVSSNTGAEVGGAFRQVIRTRIGSPYVIAGMEEAGGNVVGYEANGGFLLGFTSGKIAPLMTRDAVLPLVAVLVAAKGTGVAELVANQPPRFTAADRLQEVPTEISRALVSELDSNKDKLVDFIGKMNGVPAGVDRTDGLRITLTDGRIVHLRPSGNAPELRLYVEADSVVSARKALAQGLAVLREATAPRQP